MEATRHLDAHCDDDRYKRLSDYEKLWHGRYADGRPSFWDTTVPLRERAPAIQSMLPRTAGRRLRALVFGERTFPALKVEASAFGVAFTEDETSALSALVQEIVRRAELRRAMRAVMEAGLKCGTAVAFQTVVAGQPRVALEPAKHCTPAFDARGEVERLVVQKRVPRRGGKPGELDWYRRELGPVDGQIVDRVYARVPVDPRGGTPDWSRVAVVAEVPIPFVAVRWVKNASEAEEGSDAIDGHPLAEGLEDEVAALDLELSQLYRNALYNGDPQMVQTGVDKDPTPATGRTADPAAGTFDWAKGWITSRIFGRDPAVKKGPGNVWKLPQGGDAKLVESSGAGATIIRGAIEEIRRVVTDAAGVVIADPDVLGRGDLSAKALELLLGPMLDTASDLRVEYGAALLGVVDQFLRLCADPVVGAGIYLASLDAARSALAKLTARRADGATVWLGAPLALAWPDMVEPTWGDVKAAIDAARQGCGDRPVLSRRRAVALVAPVVGTEDLDAELDAIEDDTDAHATDEADETDEAPETGVSGTNDGTKEPEAPEVTLAPTPDVTVDLPGAPTGAAAVADTALNGAQVESMVAIVTKVAARQLPRDSAKAILMRAFAVNASAAEELLGSAGTTFTLASPAPTSGAATLSEKSTP